MTVSATASDNVGVVGVQFRLDGAALGAEDITSPYSVSWNSTTATNGSHTLTAVARDAAGNSTTSAGVTVTVANDTTPPVISAVTAAAITSSGATITWTTNEASDSQVDYGLTTAYGSSSVLNASLVTSHAVSLSGLSASTLYHFRVGSRDAAGNLALSGDVTFTTLAAPDLTPPTVSITAPAANATVSGLVTVSANASDNVGVVGVQFQLDGANLGPEVAAPLYSVSWNTLGAADLIFGVSKVAVALTINAGSGFTQRLSVSCPACGGGDMVSEDKLQSAPGSAAGTFTLTAAAHYLAQMAAFKAATTPVYLQGAVATQQSVVGNTTIAQAFASPTTAGNLIVVAAAWQGNVPITVTDSQGNVYAAATTAYDAVNDQRLAILYAANVKVGATTVTASFGSPAPTLARLEIHEYSGLATINPLDVTAMNIADGLTTADNVTSGSALTTVIAPASNGSHTLTARARDAAGNTATSAAVLVTVTNGSGDTTPPVLSAVTVSSLTASGATISWTTNEASDSQVDYGLTTAYGSSSALNASPVTAHAVPLNGLSGSTLYHFRVRSRDAAGNLATSGDFTLTTLAAPDLTPPTVSITAPAANVTVSGLVTVSANASDNVGVVGVQFKLDGAPLGAEDLTSPYAVAWNTLGAADLIFGVSKVAVALTINAGSGFTQRLSVSCPACGGGDMVSEDKLQSAPGSAAGTFTLTAAAHYLAQMAAFKAATTPVYLQGAVATQQSVVGNPTIAQAFASPATAGNLIVVAAAWQGNVPITVTDSQGNVYAAATTAYDAVNDQRLAILYAASVKVGATTVTASFGSPAPTLERLEIHEYSGLATTNPLDVTAMNIADALTTADNVTSGSALTTVVSPATAGSHTLTAVARDAAGNQATSAAVGVTVSNSTPPPVISAVSASAILSSTATITWTTDKVSDSEVEYGLTTAYGSTSTLDLSLVTGHTMPLRALTPATLYHYRARSRDSVGSLALSGDFTFTTLEGIPPTVSITAPAAAATVSGSVTVTANASDNVGVVGVQFQLDGAPLGAEDTLAPYSVVWDTTIASAGTHTLTAVARDAAGNRTTSAAVLVTVVSTPITLVWDPNTEATLAGYKVYVGTTSGVYAAPIDVGKVTTFVVPGLTPGTLYFFVVTAYDTSSNESGRSNEVSAVR